MAECITVYSYLLCICTTKKLYGLYNFKYLGSILLPILPSSLSNLSCLSTVVHGQRYMELSFRCNAIQQLKFIIEWINF